MNYQQEYDERVRYYLLEMAANRMRDRWRTSVDEYCGAAAMWRALPSSARSKKAAALLAKMDRRAERRKLAWRRLSAYYQAEATRLGFRS